MRALAALSASFLEMTVTSDALAGRGKNLDNTMVLPSTVARMKEDGEGGFFVFRRGREAAGVPSHLSF